MNVQCQMLTSSPDSFPDDACEDAFDEEDEEDSGKDHDGADAHGLREVRHQACPLSLLQMHEPVTDSCQGFSSLYLGGQQPQTEGVFVCTCILHHPLHQGYCLPGILIHT